MTDRLGAVVIFSGWFNTLFGTITLIFGNPLLGLFSLSAGGFSFIVVAIVLSERKSRLANMESE